MPKNTKKLVAVDIVLASGEGVTWSREADGLDKAALTETNVLMLLGPTEEVLIMYGPMMWLSAESHYVDVEVEDTTDQPKRIEGRRVSSR